MMKETIMRTAMIITALLTIELFVIIGTVQLLHWLV
jgi:hypothetical protein